ncbi:MAG: biopolymer transporter ExbD [Gammaproteobacteria bacterium]
MNLRRTKRKDVDLNVTPLIDVVFLLLIFFMVSTTFNRNSQLNITQPVASEKNQEQEPKAVNVTVDARGTVYVNNQPLVNAQLLTIREAIRDAAQGLKNPPVIISADRKATYQSVIRVMDAARQLNLLKITFATRRPEQNGQKE